MAKAFYPTLKIIGVRRAEFSIGKNLLSRWKYRNAALDRIVAISEGVQKVLMENGVSKESINIIYSCIDSNKFDTLNRDPTIRAKWNIPRDSILVGMIAAFDHYKDYPTFLKAASLALRERKDLFFLAVGEGELKEPIQELAQELNISDRVIFTGFQQDVEKILKTLDIFVLASKKEGLGTSILEAMAAGVPVIGTASGGIPELIKDGENGLLVPPSNPEKLKDAILKLANSPELRFRMAERGKSEAQKFDKEIMISKYIELIQEL